MHENTLLKFLGLQCDSQRDWKVQFFTFWSISRPYCMQFTQNKNQHVLLSLQINVISNLLAGRRERLECVGCTTDELWLWVLSFFCHATPSYLSLPSLTEPTPSYPVCEDEVGKVGWDGSGSQCRMGLDEVGWSRMR